MALTQKTIEKAPPQLNLKTLTYGGMTWVDISQPTKEVTRYLNEHYKFNPLDLDDALSQRQVTKIEEYPDYLFVVFHLATYDKTTRRSFRKQWSAFVGNDYLVTLHPAEFKVITEIFRECETIEETRGQYLGQGSGYLLYQVLDHAIDRYFRVLDKILSFMEDIEDNVFNEELEVAPQLSILRRDIINQRQVMFPTRTLLAELEPKLKHFSKTDLTLYFSDLMDHMNKVCATLDEYTEVIEVFKDSDFLLSSYRANRAIRTVAVLLAVIVPFLVVTSIYLLWPGGPGKGSFQVFGVMLVVIFLLIGGILLFLRRRRLV